MFRLHTNWGFDLGERNSVGNMLIDDRNIVIVSIFAVDKVSYKRAIEKLNLEFCVIITYIMNPPFIVVHIH